MSAPETPCEHCPHTKAQHDEDGFCEQEMTGDNMFCTCPGYEEKIDQEGAD